MSVAHPGTVTGRVWPLLVAVALAIGAMALSAAPAFAEEKPIVRAGRLTGPVAVRGGSQLGTVARLRLGPGNWTVFAKGVLRNTTQSGADRPVRCRVVLGGRSAQALASPAWRGTDASRRPFLLTHAAHLARGGTAALRCAAAGSRTGAVTIEDIRMAAVRTPALFVRKQGWHGTFYGNADAASQTWELTGPASLLSDDIEAVSYLSLPPGRWAITATATIVQTSVIQASQVYCRLDPDEDLLVVTVERAGEQNDRVPIVLQSLVSSSTGVNIELSCQDRDRSAGVRIRDIRLTAYRVTASARQELDPGASFNPFGAWIKPVVFMGWVDFGDGIRHGDAWRTVNRMTLPAGRWLVVSSASVHQLEGGRSSLACRVGREGKWDQTDVRLAPASAHDAVQRFVSVWTGSFERARQVQLQCRSSRGLVEMSHRRFLAYQLGTLSVQSLR